MDTDAIILVLIVKMPGVDEIVLNMSLPAGRGKARESDCVSTNLAVFVSFFFVLHDSCLL